MSTKSSQQRSEAELKQERLAEALRENLKRRKSQKRGRVALDKDQAQTDDKKMGEENT